MINQELLAMLRCPTCRVAGLRPGGRDGNGAVRFPMEQGELVCEGCGSRYPVECGVPALLPHGEATSTEDWEIWRRHLEKFQARREDRIAHPDRLVTRSMQRSRPNQPFARYTGIQSGTMLDVGCGPGKFRLNFDERRVRYVGLDPIVLPELGDFPFVRGLAEYLPFEDGSFTDVVVLAALDHFRDPTRFFEEAARVLRKDGKLHILQSVHEIHGPVSAIRVLGHRIKDAIEDWHTSAHGSDVPKHLSEFTRRSLIEAAASHFVLESDEEYSATWYSPTKLFMTLRPRRRSRTAGDATRPRQREARKSVA